jgi:parallel beta-helix repeat protein
MRSRRVEATSLFLLVLILIPALFLILGGVEAGQLRSASPPEFARVVAALASADEATAVEEATAVGYVYYDGTPVAGADVTLLRDNIAVYVTTTVASGGGLPSFTVDLSGSPIFAAADDVLTLLVEYSGQINWSNFRVRPGEQTLAGRLSSACGPTDVPGGMIAANTTWTAECGPYLVHGNMQVMSGATLTIEAGATIIFEPDLAILVNGTLLSQGTSSALTTFTSGQEEAWGYLSFGSGTTGSALAGTLVEWAGGASVANNAAIRIDGATVSLSGVIVRWNQSGGIQVFNGGTAPMDGLIVTENTGRGISIDTDVAGINIQNSIVSYNGGGGISVEGATEGLVSGNIVGFNDNTGIRIYYAVGPVTISHNRIISNETTSYGGGIDFRSTHGDIHDNYVVGNEASRSGGGVYFYSSYENALSRNFILYNRSVDTSAAGAGMYLYGRDIQVSNNIFADNFADQSATTNPGPGAGLYIPNNNHNSMGVDLIRNSFVQNYALMTPGGGLYSLEPQLYLEANTVVDNIATGPVGYAWGGIHLLDPATIYHNNLFDNRAYDLFNGGALADGTVDAQSNWWGTADAIEISDRVYDWADDANLGVVDYANWLAAPWSAAPVSPPAEVDTTVAGSSLTISWRANPESDLAGYNVYLDTSNVIFDPAIRGEIAPIDVGPVTSLTLTCLPPDTYYLAVTAYDDDVDGQDDWTDGNESWFSREVHDTTSTPPACSPPAAPTTLSATPISSGRIDLAWTDNAADETGYRIERSPNGSTDWSEIATASPNAEAYSDTGLSCGVTYYYRVRAYRAGDGQYSAYSNVDQTPTMNCPPAGPTGLGASAASASQINLAWSDNAADETAYRVERSPDGSTDWSEIASLAANSTAYSDASLACGSTYYYRVRAYRAGDGLYSSYSNVAHAATTACPPVAPSGLSATAVSASQINLAWTDNADDETSYRVERSPNGSTSWSEIVSLAANSTTYSSSGLDCGATYYYRVRAYRSGDGQYSTYSNVAHDTTDQCLPAAPGSLNATAVSASQINLTWVDNAGDESAYRVERSPNGSTSWAEIVTLPANSTSHSDSGLECGSTHYYRVRAYRGSDGQYSAYSNNAHATTDACAPPAAPSSLNAAPVSASQINLSWVDNADDESAYLVERSPTGSGGWTQITSLGAGSTGYSDSGLACGTPYYYRVRAYRAGDGQYSTYSNVDEATTDACPLPEAPSDLAATAASAEQINLSWTDNADDETTYLVERSPDGVDNWSQIAGLPANSVSYSDTGLACGTIYYYRVRAYRGGDGQYSAYSSVADAETELCGLEVVGFLPLLIKP